MAPTTFAVAGHPIHGSASPHLFHLVLAHLARRGVRGVNLDASTAVRLDVTSVEEALAAIHAGTVRCDTGLSSAAVEVVHSSTSPSEDGAVVGIPTDGALWLSLTSPLKHDIGAWHHLDDSKAWRSVNTLRVLNGRIEAMSTDGLAVVRIARLRGVAVDKGAVLALRGGGGAARSTAQAWIAAGGRVLPIHGRRELQGIPPESLARHGAAFGVDVDGGASKLEAPCVLHPAYRLGEPPLAGGRLESDAIDGRWMLAAQHLEAWSRCWAPDVAAFLPELSRLVADLVTLEARVDAAWLDP